MDEKQTRLYGALGSTFLHLVIFALLWHFGLSHIIQPKENEGIEVMLGNVEQARGNYVPGVIHPRAQEAVDISTPRQVVKVQSAPVLTQNTEESQEMLEQKKKLQEQRQMDLLKQQEENRLREQERARQAELQRQQAVKQQKINEINKKMSGAFGSGGNAGSSGTAASGKGVMGSPTGNSTKGAVSGIGGNGNTVSYSLSGRKVSGVLVEPNDNNQVQGKIEVDISVDSEGKVYLAEINIAHSTISNKTVRNAALLAAKRTRFNGIDSDNNQSGSITYIYRLK